MAKKRYRYGGRPVIIVELTDDEAKVAYLDTRGQEVAFWVNKRDIEVREIDPMYAARRSQRNARRNPRFTVVEGADSYNRKSWQIHKDGVWTGRFFYSPEKAHAVVEQEERSAHTGQGYQPKPVRQAAPAPERSASFISNPSASGSAGSRPAEVSLYVGRGAGRPAGQTRPRAQSSKAEVQSESGTKPAKRSEKLFDPGEEQLRAQGQAIYESAVKKRLGRKYNAPFIDEMTGQRLDVELIFREGVDAVRELISRNVFAIGTSVQQRHGFVEPGTRAPTSETIARSMERYDNPDHLIRNRQRYEETLGIARKSGFYRVVPEQIASGVGYFIWPMPPGQEAPLGFDTADKAKKVAADWNRHRSPLETLVWWSEPRRPYTKQMLAHWLPPASAFKERRS